MESHIFSIPSDIIVNVICPFLILRDLSDLDIAVTSKKSRPFLHSMYQMLHRDHSPSGLTHEQMMWFFKRGISMKSVSFVPIVSDTLLFSLASHQQACSNLTSIDLSHCREVSDVAMIEVSQQCYRLTDLDLSYTYCRNETLMAFAMTSTSLRSLNIASDLHITDESVQFLAQRCPLLQSVDMSQCQHVSSMSLKAIAKYSSALTSLRLCSCHMSDQGVLELASGCPALTSLDLSYSLKTVSTSALLALANGNHNLTNLHLSSCSVITDEVVGACALKSSQIRNLDLSGCSRITDLSVKTAALNCLFLSILDLSHCSVTDEAVLTLAKYSAQLTSLDLSFTGVTDQALMYISSLHHCPVLASLYLTGCSVTDEGLKSLSRKWNHYLSTLDIRCCNFVTIEVMEQLYPESVDVNVYW